MTDIIEFHILSRWLRYWKVFLYLKEKITLGISLLLSLVVFLTMIVKKFLPPTSLAFPLIAKYLVFTFVMNLSSMATSVYVINVNHRETCHMPNTLKWIFLFALPWLLFMDRTRKHRYDYSNKKINQPFTKLLVILYLNFTLEKHLSMECNMRSVLINLQIWFSGSWWWSFGSAVYHWMWA